MMSSSRAGSLTELLAGLGLLAAGFAPALAQQPAAGAPEAVLLRAAADRVWSDLTSDDGLRRLFAVAQASAGARTGGLLQTHHDPRGTLGDPGTVALEIVALEPGRVLALRTPAAAGGDDKPGAGVLVLRLEPLGPDRTRLWITRHGWQLPGPLGEHLLLGPTNRRTAADLQAHYAAGPDPSAPAAVQGLLQQLVGGTWMASLGTIDARRTFQVRVGSTVEIEEWRGDGRAVVPFARVDCSLDPASDAVVFVRWQADGSFVRGHVRVPRRGVVEFVGAAADGRQDVVRWALRDGRLAGEAGDRLVFERKDAVPAKQR